MERGEKKSFAHVYGVLTPWLLICIFFGSLSRHRSSHPGEPACLSHRFKLMVSIFTPNRGALVLHQAEVFRPGELHAAFLTRAQTGGGIQKEAS